MMPVTRRMTPATPQPGVIVGEYRKFAFWNRHCRKDLAELPPFEIRLLGKEESIQLLKRVRLKPPALVVVGRL